MVTIRQNIKVDVDGLVEVRSADLRAGDTAEVIVLVDRSPAPSDETGEPRRKNWRDYAGIFNSGDPHSSDNERIDADLARSYAATNDPTGT